MIKHKVALRLNPAYYNAIEESDFVRIGLKDLEYRSNFETERFLSYHNYKNKPAVISVVNKPIGSRVLVLAPHPDDDIIGCGGVLLKHSKAGDKITVVYLTQSQRYCERSHEARRALRIIGISNSFFLNYEEGTLHLTPSIVSKIRKLLNELTPDIVYLPFFFERSFDHRETNRIFIEAANHIEEPIKCYAYEVWGKLYPNRVVDITKEMPRKIEALSVHKTQTKEFNCVGMTVNLNLQRASMIFKKKGYAECFYYAKLRDYIDLYLQIYRL